MQSVSAEQTQISLSPVPRTLCGDRDKKVQADTQNWLAGIGTPSASSLGAAVGGRPFLWLIVGLMPKKNPLVLDSQRVGASDSLTSISSCDLICCHAREDRSGSIGGSTVRFGSVVPSLKGRAGLNNQAERRERSMDHQRCSGS